jgi:hypothetical protein
MDTHLPKVYQPKVESNRLLMATYPTPNALVIPSLRVQSQTGSMCNAWAVDLNHLQHGAHNEHEPLISTAPPHLTANNKTPHRTPTHGNSSSQHSPRTPHRQPNSTEVVRHSTTSAALPPQHQPAHFLLVQATTHTNNPWPHHPNAQAHKSSANLLRHLYPPKSHRCCRKIVHKPRRSTEMILAHRLQDGRWQKGSQWEVVVRRVYLMMGRVNRHYRRGRGRVGVRGEGGV